MLTARESSSRIATKTEITKTLEYLCQQLGELDVSTILPADFENVKL